MSRQFSKTLAISQLAKLVLPAAFAAFLVLGTSPARADDAVFVAGYNGQASVQMDEDSGNILIQAILPGSSNWLPGSQGYFSHAILPNDPTTLNGAFMLAGGDTGTVTGTYQGTQTQADLDGIVLISGTYTIMDGWLEDFGAAVGSGVIDGVVNLNTGQMSVTLIGTVSPATPTPS